MQWDKGRAYALRPAFRELGHVAAFVFEAIEAGCAHTITTLDAVAAQLRRYAVDRQIWRSHLTRHDPDRAGQIVDGLVEDYWWPR